MPLQSSIGETRITCEAEQRIQGTANGRNQTLSTPHANLAKPVTASNRKFGIIVTSEYDNLLDD